MIQKTFPKNPLFKPMRNLKSDGFSKNMRSKMEDLDIIKQLMNGNHLSHNELERAVYLIGSFKADIERRIKTGGY